MSKKFELLDASLDLTLNEILIAPNKHGELMPSLQCLEQIARKISKEDIGNILTALHQHTFIQSLRKN